MNGKLSKRTTNLSPQEMTMLLLKAKWVVNIYISIHRRTLGLFLFDIYANKRENQNYLVYLFVFDFQ